MSNYREELPQLIYETKYPIVCIFVEGRCRDSEFESKIQTHLVDCMSKTDQRYVLYTVCNDSVDMPFPEPKADFAYIFAPGVLRPVTSLPAQVFFNVDNLNNYINAIYKMMDDENLEFHRALLPSEEADHVDEVSNMISEEERDPEYPPFMKMVRGFAKDVVNSAKRVGSKLPVIVPKDVAQERYELCQSCPYFTEESRCEKCGCFMTTKVNLAASECPIGKWNKYE
jgi:hypothetical protein